MADVSVTPPPPALRCQFLAELRWPFAPCGQPATHRHRSPYGAVLMRCDAHRAIGDAALVDEAEINLVHLELEVTLPGESTGPALTIAEVLTVLEREVARLGGSVSLRSTGSTIVRYGSPAAHSATNASAQGGEGRARA